MKFIFILESWWITTLKEYLTTFIFMWIAHSDLVLFWQSSKLTIQLFLLILYLSVTPSLPLLRTLFTRSEGDLAPLANLSKLSKINLSGNNLKSFQSLVFLRNIPSLRTLSLKGNPFCSHKSYPSAVFQILSNVSTIDSWWELLTYVKCICLDITYFPLSLFLSICMSFYDK